MRVFTLKDCQEFASEREGWCLSNEYKNTKTKMLWKCKNNEHLAWKATFGSIKDCNSWCPKCAGKSKHTLSDCMKWAQNKNGKCLSKEYNNCMTKMLWKCDNSEHSAWSATFNDILSGKWCIHCAGKVKHSIKKCQDFAKNKGGKCLSTKYKNCDTKMLWHCGNTKHPIWKSTFHNIKNRNSWCPYCANVAKMSLKDCQDFAKKKGGMCLSKKYTNNGNEMLWKCHNHKHLSWKAPFKRIKNQNSWCPECNVSKTQKMLVSLIKDILVINDIVECFTFSWLKYKQK